MILLFRGWLALSALLTLQLAAAAQASDGAYFNFTAWTLGESVPGVDPAIRLSKQMKTYEKVTFLDDQEKRIPALNELWGVVWKDTLYLRLEGRYFIGMKEMGAFSYFTGPRYHSQEDADRVGRNALLFGLIGGGIAVAATDAKNKDLIHYVMNARTGLVHLLHPGYMRIVLADLPELMDRFNAEADKTAPETMLRYLRSANSQLARTN